MKGQPVRKQESKEGVLFQKQREENHVIKMLSERIWA